MVNGSSITTNGGDINISTGTFDSSNQIGNFTLQTLNSSGLAGANGGAITVNNSKGNIDINNQLIANGGNAGNINIDVGNQFTQNAAISAVGGIGTNGNITINGDNTSNIFTFNAGTSLTGGTITVNGLDGTDTFNISAIVAAVIDGGNGTDNLMANNVANTWIVSSANGGTVTGTGGFSNIENLLGNVDTDDFTINGGSIESIDGAGGINSLTGRQ